MQRHKFSVAFGVGGYAVGPDDAWPRACTACPSVIFEPNVEPGFTNRVLAGIATRVAVRFRRHRQAFWRESVATGIPVRQEFFADRRAASIAKPFNVS